jgi:hypothetical protein
VELHHNYYFINDEFIKDRMIELAYNYIIIYANTEKIECAQIEINVFKNMLYNPILNNDVNFSQFFISITSLINLKNHINFDIIRYKYKLIEDTDNKYNYISMIQEGNHYLLCLYDDEFTMERHI